MQQFGVTARVLDGGRAFAVPTGAYVNPAEVAVEGDASSASYALAMAAATGGCVAVDNVGAASLQGDARFCTLLERMGARVEQSATATVVCAAAEDDRTCRHVCGRATGSNATAAAEAALGAPASAPPPPLRALGRVDMSAMTDTFLTLAAVCALADGPSQLVNIANQRVKECDRLAAVAAELRRCGVEARELESGVEIVGVGARGRAALAERLRAAPAWVRCHNDHRMAMAFAVLGTALPNVVLTDRACVGKVRARPSPSSISISISIAISLVL